MRRCVYVLLTVVIVFTSSAFAQAGNDRPYDSVVRANNDFAVNFVSEAYKQAAQKNVLTSPAALSYGFGLLLNGASSPARDEIARAFGVQDISLADLNAGNAELKKMRASTYVTPAKYKAMNLWDRRQVDTDHWTHRPYTVSGAFWADKRAFSPQFLAINRTSYGFTPKNQQPSAAALHLWAVGANRGREVPFVAAPASRNRQFALTMLTRFNTRWRDEFRVSDTRPAEFHLLAGTTKTVPFMQQNGKFRHCETDRIQAVKLDFTDGSMIVVLPSEQSSLGEFMEGLSPEQWREVNKKLGERPGHLELPRFELEQRGDVVPVLKQMGVRTIFSDLDALVPAVGPNGGMLTSVLVGGSMKLNEKGVELVTYVDIHGVIGGVCGGNCTPPPPFRMIVNRPFFFAIVDWTGEILYTGTVAEP